MLRIAMGLHNAGDYHLHSLTCLHTVLARASCPVRLYLLHDATVTPAQQALFAQLVGAFSAEARFVNLEQYAPLLRAHERGSFSIATFFRLLIPQCLPGMEILYLDSDICLTLDVAELVSELAGWEECIGAVADAALCMERFAQWVSELGVEAGRYFNAGVLYLHTGRLNARFPHFFADTVALLQRRRYNFPDQDVLNLYCAPHAGLVRYLPEKYNYSLSVRQRHLLPPEALAGKVLHYGYHKPWATVFPAGVVYWQARTAMLRLLGLA